ncbi:lipopolysaccharide biosynthesis protein [Providencia sp. Me31A]|uniref:lipopolysaccharide biosynthesis protein n=1 Tax=Providencia sp. Me31A TaxID=3392637 RepID=UPI003D296EDA
MDTDTKKQLFSGITWSAIDKLVTQIGYLVVTLFIAKVIGPESFGLIGMLTIFMLLSEIVINNGFSQALVQRSHQATEADFSTAFYISITLGILLYFILFFSAPWISAFYKKPELINISRVLFLVIIINSFSIVSRAKLIIRVDFKKLAISSTISTIFSSIIAIYFLFIGYGYWSFVYLILLRSFFSSTIIWFFAHWVPALSFSKKSFKQLSKFSINLMFAGFISTLVNNLHIVLIGRYFNASNVGFFSQSTNLTNFLAQFISSTLQKVTYPILTSLKEKEELLFNLYKQLLSMTMFISFPIFIGFFAISQEVVQLFLGKEWLTVVPIIQILCLARITTPITIINMNILNAIGRSDLFLKVELLKFPIAMISLFISIPYGINAVAISILVTAIISYFINAYYPRKFFGFGALSQLNAAKNYIFSSSIMCFLIMQFSFESLWINLAFKIIIGAISYFTVLILIKDKLITSALRVFNRKIFRL